MYLFHLNKNFETTINYEFILNYSNVNLDSASSNVLTIMVRFGTKFWKNETFFVSYVLEINIKHMPFYSFLDFLQDLHIFPFHLGRVQIEILWMKHLTRLTFFLSMFIAIKILFGKIIMTGWFVWINFKKSIVFSSIREVASYVSRFGNLAIWKLTGSGIFEFIRTENVSTYRALFVLFTVTWKIHLGSKIELNRAIIFLQLSIWIKLATVHEWS